MYMLCFGLICVFVVSLCMCFVCFLIKVKSFDEVLNCYRITGNENIVMEVMLTNQRHLEQFIDQLISYGETKTQIVLSSVIENTAITKTKLYEI